MTSWSLGSLLNAVILVPLTLLPIINPLSSAPIFMMTAGSHDPTVKLLARQVAINCWIVIVGALLVGTYVLDLFGISLPIVRVAGGLLVAASGWRMLQSNNDDAVHQALAQQTPTHLAPDEIVNRSFFPITFPLTTGPGTIAASIALGAGLPRNPAQYLLGAGAAMVGATLTVAVIYLIYRHSARLLMRLGPVGTMVMMRMLAFVLLCIGIEIMWTGWSELNGLQHR